MVHISHSQMKFCSSSVREFSLMKHIEVSSPKANKKDAEIISSKVVKVFFYNFDLRRSNYFTLFFIFQTHILNHINQKISHHQGAIKRPSCVHQREPRKTFSEWMTFLPFMWIFRYRKKTLERMV